MYCIVVKRGEFQQYDALYKAFGGPPTCNLGIAGAVRVATPIPHLLRPKSTAPNAAGLRRRVRWRSDSPWLSDDARQRDAMPL
jgi:hypothetical protein